MRAEDDGFLIASTYGRIIHVVICAHVGHDEINNSDEGKGSGSSET